MVKIGSALCLILASSAWAEVEFYQTADRTKVGTEDTFSLTIVLGDAPEGAALQFPTPDEFEVLSRSQSTQMSYRMGGGGAGVIQRLQKYTLVLRANKTGTLTIPASVLTAGGKTWKTQPLKIEVVKGRGPPDPRAQQQPPGHPSIGSPFPGFPDFDDDKNGFPAFPEPDIPRSDSDLFLKASLDKTEVYVGEQVTLTLVIFSRVDLSSVDAVSMPKLEGFWSEDLDTPTQLAPEQRSVGGVPYRAYLLRRRALFPVKAGALTIGAAEADITTGFLFNGHRVHRKANTLALKVKPLPPTANGAQDVNVGQWRLSAEASQTQVKLGEPIQVKVTLEGKGNLRNLNPPALNGPSSVKIYEPTTTDKLTVAGGLLGGKRVQEYVVLPSQTGDFTLPGLSLPFFNPETGRHEESKTDPLVLHVAPSSTGATAMGIPSASPSIGDAIHKNRLEATGLKSLRHTASFATAAPALWTRPFFIPMALLPLVALLSWGFVGLIRNVVTPNSPAALKKAKTRAARAKLSAAQKLLKSGKTTDFYAEVERSVFSFLEAELASPVVGLTRPALDEKLSAFGASALVRAQIMRVLETCDMGRYAPGMGDEKARERAIDDAVAALGGFGTK